MKYYLIKNNKISAECLEQNLNTAYAQGFMILKLDIDLIFHENGFISATLEQNKLAAKTYIDYLKEDKKYKPTIEFNSNIFNSDKASVELIESNINLHNMLGLTELQAPWWNTENADTITKVADLAALAVAISQRIYTEMETARQVKNNINKATTKEEIDTIVSAYKES